MITKEDVKKTIGTLMNLAREKSVPAERYAIEWYLVNDLKLILEFMDATDAWTLDRIARKAYESARIGGLLDMLGVLPGGIWRRELALFMTGLVGDLHQRWIEALQRENNR